jgi:SET domain
MGFEIRHRGRCGSQLVVSVALRKGTIIARFHEAEVISSPSWRSLQIADDRHIEDIGMIQYVNHSCDPNLYFDAERLEVEVLRDLEAGEELTLFYPSSEWEMARPFECCCGSDACLGLISGATGVALSRYRINRHNFRSLRGHRRSQ